MRTAALRRCIPRRASRPRSSPRLWQKVVTTCARREMATEALAHYAMSIRLACQVFKVSEGCYRDQPVLADEHQAIGDWRLATAPHRQPAQLGLRALLPEPAQCQRLLLEPQPDIPELSDAGAQSADKTQETAGACQTGAIGCP